MKKSEMPIFKSLAVLAVLCLTVLFCPVKVKAGGVEDAIARIANTYNTGSYFSSTGQPCGPGQTNFGYGRYCTYCQLYVMDREAALACGNGDSCYSFANYVFYRVFGMSPRNLQHVSTNNPNNCAQIGDYVLCYNSGASTPSHYLIYMGSAGSNTFYAYEANADRENKVVYKGLHNGANWYGLWARYEVVHATNYDQVNKVEPDNIVNLGDSFDATIVKSSGSLPLEVQGTNVAASSARSNAANQDWHFTRQSDKTYIIKSYLNGQVLDVSGASNAEGTNVGTYTQWGDNNGAQRWYICNAGNGYYLIPKLDSNRYLNVDGSANIVIRGKGSAESQVFTFQMFNYVGPSKISVTGDEIVGVGDKIKLAVDYGNATDKKGVKWSSSDASVASVSADGEVSGLKEGTAVITATSIYNPNVTASKKVTVQILHQYEKVVLKEPTCEEKGLAQYTCSDCGESYTEEIPALGHAYSSKVIAPSVNEKGYTVYTCSRCGNSYKDNYTDAIEIAEDGFIYSDVLPDYVTDDLFQIEYKSYYEQNATTSPGSDWKQGAVVSEKWVDKGSAYNTMTEYPTSSERVLLSARYFHFCGPNAGNVGNYYQTDKFVHYDGIDASAVTANIVEYDEGHPVYFVYLNGSQLSCQSGVTCDGSHGSHGQRCKAWYKEYTYIDREKVVTYKYTKETGYTNTYDKSATKVSYRFKPTTPAVKITTTASGGNDVTVQASYEAYGIFSGYYTTVAHGFVLDDREEVRYTEFNEEGCYTLKLKQGQKTSAKAFITYKDKNGKETTIYSDTVSLN